MKRGKSYQKDLIQYRLDSAREMLRDARLHQENGGSAVSIVNRAYYSVFYAALALLVTAVYGGMVRDWPKWIFLSVQGGF